MQKITPHLWFDKEAKEAVEFYISLFPDSRITNVTTLHDTPSGDCDVVSFELSKQSFMAISAGPFFKFNPSISLLINFNPSQERDAEEKLHKLWRELSCEGKALMPLQEYPFSQCYGWIEDKFGLSWQLILSDSDAEKRSFITPSLMFAGKMCGKAEEAINFYTSIFDNSRQGIIARYNAKDTSNKEGTVMFADFMLAGQWFAAMDNAQTHDFTFNEAISFVVNCETQKEIDYYWEKLSAVPEAEQCGWLKDKYGLSWQISPTVLEEMMQKGTRKQVDQITQAFLTMKKFDIATLKRVYEAK
ncbi:VOC family protein [Legionella clemsonensis]|uniref:3-demethylubiquinone-9 3-methyltransferase n=1 Tax=Legionella clemsonensis TaxID=1867846 RepID=A0A222P642_9GAMM|nr:VOC family protein [Legionella clemsonensis]ASQ47316.1 3-demethylubiquinone-9 3-methyltransferase [Legionella clemsonensis]